MPGKSSILQLLLRKMLCQILRTWQKTVMPRCSTCWLHAPRQEEVRTTRQSHVRTCRTCNSSCVASSKQKLAAGEPVHLILSLAFQAEGLEVHLRRLEMLGLHIQEAALSPSLPHMLRHLA
mmetsp:Transcript_65378/g.156314  ORF Transcript_65378/g.156314 Transcript_65378/m.156314 type:complete len:121 (-) Transcript_65378:857-1219(-)